MPTRDGTDNPYRGLIWGTDLFLIAVLLLWKFEFFDGSRYRVVLVLAVWADIIGVHIKLAKAASQKSLNRPSSHLLKKYHVGSEPSKLTKDSVHYVKPPYLNLLIISATMIGIDFFPAIRNSLKLR